MSKVLKIAIVSLTILAGATTAQACDNSNNWVLDDHMDFLKSTR